MLERELHRLYLLHGGGYILYCLRRSAGLGVKEDNVDDGNGWFAESKLPPPLSGAYGYLSQLSLPRSIPTEICQD